MSASMAIAAWSKNASCAGLIRTALAEAAVFLPPSKCSWRSTRHRTPPPIVRDADP